MSSVRQSGPAVGDNLVVTWPLEDGKFQDFYAKVEKVETQKKKKRKYSLRFEDGELRSTKLTHLKHRILQSGTAERKEMDWRFILAPMVGGSELPFRLLCRKYGATLAYTPMMNSEKFAVDEAYRDQEFQTTASDRPLVAHFSANNADTILKAAKLVEQKCDAIDINLGCPQRIAFSGHFGSYLLGEEDRALVLSMVSALSKGISIPVFVKIRLLDTVADTIALCLQLADAGANLIAVHARYRVNLVGRSGPGARDGPAFLDQVVSIREALRSAGHAIPIISNGNIITGKDVMDNMQFTGADGVMSAEGLLDNPALYAEARDDIEVKIPNKLELALEYLCLVEKYPTKLKSVIFHVRRICKHELEAYQLMEECVCKSDVKSVKELVLRAIEYQKTPKTFVFNVERQRAAKEFAERKKREEGKRKEFEARMIRKAKREGKALDFYLLQGGENPTQEILERLKEMPKELAFEEWKANHSQHCYAFHFEGGCPRDRKCAFLHADASIGEAVAYG